jgi:hypothetical protein
MDLTCAGVNKGSPYRCEYAYRIKIPDKDGFMPHGIAFPDVMRSTAWGRNMPGSKAKTGRKNLRMDDMLPQGLESFYQCNN